MMIQHGRKTDTIKTAVQPSSASPPERAAVTQLLIDWKSGKKEALDLLVPLVYQELCHLSDRYLQDERAAAKASSD
jgi:hypothetical protein